MSNRKGVVRNARVTNMPVPVPVVEDKPVTTTKKEVTKMATSGAVNWKAAERTLVAEDTYDALITKAEVRAKPNSVAVKQVFAEFTITESGDFEGRKMFKQYDITDESLWSLRTDLMAMGADEDEFEGDTEDELLQNITMLVDRYFAAQPCTIEVKHNPDRKGKVDKNGEPVIYANVQAVKAQ